MAPNQLAATAETRLQPAADRASAFRAGCLEALRLSGLFQPGYYLQSRRELPPGADPLEDYYDLGWTLGHWPNPYFDPGWYRAQNPDVQASGSDPLLHYLAYGEQENRRPVPWFDPAWYRQRHDVGAVHCLRHFLDHRCDGTASPIPEFDSAWYRDAYPDVAAARMDPMEHYLLQGFRESRNPSAEFDTRFYRARYLANQPDINPLLHYLKHRHEPGVFPRMPQQETSIPRELRKFTAPGPDFELAAALPPGSRPLATVLAYYLPQYHPIPENDDWWGKGFTEWTNLGRGLPRFAGHYQPRIPRDLGHYRLDDPEVMRQQIALARGAGLGGFVFYFYWFDGRRLLEKPLEQFLADRSMDFPFCLMWANENWTRRWDGADQEVLIAQHYDGEDEAALIACFARHFADPRYIRLQRRPLLMVYRPRLIPDAKTTVARWRSHFRRVHGEDPILVMAQSFGDEDPREFGLDGATEFPPHKLVHGLDRREDSLTILDPDFTAQVYNFGDLADASSAAPTPDYPLIRAAIPGWDNDARRQGQGLVVHGATPARYQAWLEQLIERACAEPFFGTPLVCINAWNEWAEGAYLEPDQHFGAAFLNATGRAIGGAMRETTTGKLILVGHDAFPAGAQMLLLNLGRQLQAAHGVRVHFLLCGEGALEPAYRAVAPVAIVPGAAALNDAVRRLYRQGYHCAIVNSAASAWCLPSFAAHGIPATLLVHEMPRLLADRALLMPLNAAAATAEGFVFAAPAVRDAVLPLLERQPRRHAILPQGLYQRAAPPKGGTARLWRELGLGQRGRLVIGMGYADLRKGLDLFLQVWRLASIRCPDLHMAWAGETDPTIRGWLDMEITAAEATGRFHLLGFRKDVASLLDAADLFLLTSREDPYPSVALEALCAGTRVLAFDGSGGIPDLLRRLNLGGTIPMADCAAMADAVAACALAPVRRRVPPGVVAQLRATHSFDHYAESLLDEAWPDEPRVSVIISTYRQAAMLPRRLRSIFAQTYPVQSLVLRDDASDDDSIAVAQAVAQEGGRTLQIVRAASNSGSAFGCWRDAVAQATGDLVWIAEADDASEPQFLERAAAALRDPAVLFAFAHSRPIDPDGAARLEDYTVSYRQAAGPGALAQDELFDAGTFFRRFLAERNILFNVSAVVWRRDVLHGALMRLGDDLLSWRVAGDWRLYLEVLTGPAAAGGQVAYFAAPLNQHCRHEQSVTAMLDADRHLSEIRRMHRLIRERLGATPDLLARQAGFLEQAAAWLLCAAPFTAVAAE